MTPPRVSTPGTGGQSAGNTLPGASTSEDVLSPVGVGETRARPRSPTGCSDETDGCASPPSNPLSSPPSKKIRADPSLDLSEEDLFDIFGLEDEEDGDVVHVDERQATPVGVLGGDLAAPSSSRDTLALTARLEATTIDGVVRNHLRSANLVPASERPSERLRSLDSDSAVEISRTEVGCVEWTVRLDPCVAAYLAVGMATPFRVRARWLLHFAVGSHRYHHLGQQSDLALRTRREARAGRALHKGSEAASAKIRAAVAAFIITDGHTRPTAAQRGAFKRTLLALAQDVQNTMGAHAPTPEVLLAVQESFVNVSACGVGSPLESPVGMSIFCPKPSAASETSLAGVFGVEDSSEDLNSYVRSLPDEDIFHMFNGSDFEEIDSASPHPPRPRVLRSIAPEEPFVTRKDASTPATADAEAPAPAAPVGRPVGVPPRAAAGVHAPERACVSAQVILVTVDDEDERMDLRVVFAVTWSKCSGSDDATPVLRLTVPGSKSCSERMLWSRTECTDDATGAMCTHVAVDIVCYGPPGPPLAAGTQRRSLAIAVTLSAASDNVLLSVDSAHSTAAALAGGWSLPPGRGGLAVAKRYAASATPQPVHRFVLILEVERQGVPAIGYLDRSAIVALAASALGLGGGGARVSLFGCTVAYAAMNNPLVLKVSAIAAAAISAVSAALAPESSTAAVMAATLHAIAIIVVMACASATDSWERRRDKDFDANLHATLDCAAKGAGDHERKSARVYELHGVKQAVGWTTEIVTLNDQR